ncbi:the calponin-homology domain of Rng2, partial [Cunninghamella echinulata]
KSCLTAYEYLCRIGEAKEWIEDCIQEEIPSIFKLEENLRNGIILAKLSNWILPEAAKKIYYGNKLQFRHSDNINHYLSTLRTIGLPITFWFELTDLYDKKNIPKVIHSIHALSHFLARRNMAPCIKDLAGKLEFTSKSVNDNIIIVYFYM